MKQELEALRKEVQELKEQIKGLTEALVSALAMQPSCMSVVVPVPATPQPYLPQPQPPYITVCGDNICQSLTAGPQKVFLT